MVFSTELSTSVHPRCFDLSTWCYSTFANFSPEWFHRFFTVNLMQSKMKQVKHINGSNGYINDSTVWVYLRFAVSKTRRGVALVVRWNADLAMLGRGSETGLVQTGNIELSTPYTQHRNICGGFPARHASKGSGEKQAMFGCFRVIVALYRRPRL